MYQVRIPDEVYRQAAEAAEAQHVSVEEFVTETLQLRLQDTDDAAIQRMFTPERLALIAAAQAEIDSGQGISFEQWRSEFDFQRAARLKGSQR